MNEIYLSVVIPAYNEERNLRLGALENVYSYLIKQTYTWEVIVVDDGSTDGSRRIIKQIIKDHNGFRLIGKKHQGKAVAVSSGVLDSKGKYILFSDLDQATPINQIEKLIHYFDKGYDLVIGSRNNKRKGAPFLRLAMAKGFMILRNLILDLHIRDTQCGFKVMTNKLAYDIMPKLQVFNLNRNAIGSTVSAGFDIEFLYLAKIKGYKIIEVPVDWHYQETRHVNPIKDSIESILDLMRIKMNSLTGKYR